MNAAIKVEKLSKLYRIGLGEHANYQTLRDSIMQTMAAPFRMMKGSKRKAAGANVDDLWALKDVSFEVKRGEVLGIVGRNGAGKSTLLKVLSRITPPTGGNVRIGGRVGSLLEVGTGFHPELTGRENIYLNGAILGMSRREIAKKFNDIVEFSEVERFLDTPVKRYSSGMYTRLAFAVASHLEPEILIVDEVLAVGDAQFQKKCLGRMNEVSREGRTVLFVSHNMSAMKTLCTRGIVMEGGRVGYDGDVDQAVNRYLDAGDGNPHNGIIAENCPRISDVKGEALVRRVRLADVNGKDIQQVFFGQPFQVVMTVEVMQDIEDAHLEISFSTLDGVQVSYSAATDGGVPPTFLRKGLHEVSSRFENTLLPREYTIDVGVHHHANGTTADFVQRTLDFTVLRVAESGNDHYHWPRTRGLVRARGQWSVDGAVLSRGNMNSDPQD